MPTIPDVLLGCTPAERAALLQGMPEARVRALARSFGEWAHGGQLAPPGDWRTWVLMAGRGFGKTRAGAEWVLDTVRRSTLRPRGGGDLGPGSAPSPETSAFRPKAGSLSRACRGAGALGGARGETLRIALVAATADEARAVMVEGPSGLLACARPGEIGDWRPARRELVFAGGAIATLFSGANPEALRGPQHHFAWCDELAKWRHPETAWDMLQLGLRCGTRPRALVTTTPRGGCAALRRILAATDTALTGGPTRANPHLPAAFLAAAQSAYGGSRLGRQELDGVLLEDVEGSLWPLALLEACRDVAPPPRGDFVRVVIGVDPPASAAGTCGIVACGIDRAGVGHVLGDHSAAGLSPEGWAGQVAAAATAHGADRVVVETNQGGDMVRAVLRAADAAQGSSTPVRGVTARAGKTARAEPIAALFEAGRVRLSGHFPALEEQLTGLTAGKGYAGPGASPDRADAMVWALWALLIATRAEPRISLG